MTRPCFLCDENVDISLIKGLLKVEPAMDILRVGLAGAPPKKTSDPDLLLFAEATGRGLITLDRRTMPQHISDHLAAGHHTWGVFILRRHFALRRYVEDFILIWSISEAAEWRDRIESIPWMRPP